MGRKKKGTDSGDDLFDATGDEPAADDAEQDTGDDTTDDAETVDAELVDDDADDETGVRPDQTTTMRIEGPTALRTMMSQYFIEYASYVIKDRAIPDIADGLKPVQRRILHTLMDVDDGKYHKVANVVGRTMSYHPHGDSSIYAALVAIANKEFFIDRQGNFGNIFTGDQAAAARYIECRLSPLAKEVLFNKEITEYIPSYDGRNQEPVALPAKVPVLLMQGADGIAVGMSTRILPHNFNELLDAQIQYLKAPDKPIHLFPDFLQGGIMDVSEYDDGNGKIRLRALIQENGKNSLVIREIPAVTSTESLINSVEDAAGKGKIKISSISDYTAESVEIDIQLVRGTNVERTIKALYAHTDCEVSISCNCLVIKENRPEIVSVSKMLKYNTDKLMKDLGRELEIELDKLGDLFHAKTLAQIFIENRIYKKIEECKTQEAVLEAVHTGLKPFRKMLTRDVTDEDIEKLLQIPIRRISLFDIEKNKRDLDEILAKIEEVKDNLANLRRYTIDYIKALKKKYGDLYPRRTRVDSMEEVSKRDIAIANLKVGHDRANGFVGTAVKADDPMSCTEYDRLVILGWDGVFKVIPVPEKLYVGSVCAIYKADREQVYSMIYRERKSKICYAKRFKVDSYIMDKEYKSIPKGCKVEKLFDRYGVVLQAEFEPMKGQKVSQIELDFEEIPIRGATARGLKVHAKTVTKFIQLKRGTDVNPYAVDDKAKAAETDSENDVPAAALKLNQPGIDQVAVMPAMHSPLREQQSRAEEKKTPRAKKAASKKADTAAPRAKSDDTSKPIAGKSAIPLTPGLARSADDEPVKPAKPKAKPKRKKKPDDEDRFDGSEFDLG